MKRFICLLFSSLFILGIFVFDSDNVAYAMPYEIEGYTYEDLDFLKRKIKEYDSLMEAAHNMASAARDLGYDESHSVIRLARGEYYSYERERSFYKRIYDTLLLKWESKRNEYPDATEVWEYLKKTGYSDYVCAGILGNIMTEVGGNTLNIQPLLETTEYYGMCQWSSFYPDAWDLSLDEQCKFLIDTIEEEFSLFGKLYQRGMTYEKFLSMTDCQDIALCFAKVYERCDFRSYSSRKDNAVMAYNYFVS